ncbi:hypothetical protein [Devosia naphthalenivorans]|uniref:hypothetical protein n=1 Tax=Devosia naphthalenivorans TaxID=2082392 RepID=UPI000D373D9B|nr:hypothetical protein [Devosia naphthalenivorans]
MSDARGYIFYTYSSAAKTGEHRWYDDGVDNEFFESEVSAREAVETVFRETIRDGEAMPTAMCIVKIETVSLTKESVLALLNNDLKSFVRVYEVVDTVNPPKQIQT